MPLETHTSYRYGIRGFCRYPTACTCKDVHMPRDLSHSRDAQALFLSPRNMLAPQGNIYRLRRQIRGMIVFGSCRQPNYQVIYATVNITFQRIAQARSRAYWVTNRIYLQRRAFVRNDLAFSCPSDTPIPERRRQTHLCYAAS